MKVLYLNRSKKINLKIQDCKIFYNYTIYIKNQKLIKRVQYVYYQWDK